MPKFFSRDAAPDRKGSGPPGTRSDAVGEVETARASGYDRVGIVVDGAEIHWMTSGQFQALPLIERVRMLAGGEMRFYRGALEITAVEAMRGVP